jgi:hypothetical protein
MEKWILKQVQDDEKVPDRGTFFVTCEDRASQ